jgi:hypothetical protein
MRMWLIQWIFGKTIVEPLNPNVKAILISVDIINALKVTLSGELFQEEIFIQEPIASM